MCGDRPQDNGQRQSDAEEPDRNTGVLLGLSSIHRRRIGEQDQRQGEVNEQSDRVGLGGGRQHADEAGAEHGPGEHQDDRCRDGPPVELACRYCVGNEHHRNHRPAAAHWPSQAVDDPRFGT